jgi:hypothetical protein
VTLQITADDHRNDIGGNALSVAAVLLAFYVQGLWWVDATVAMVGSSASVCDTELCAYVTL